MLMSGRKQRSTIIAGAVIATVVIAISIATSIMVHRDVTRSDIATTTGVVHTTAQPSAAQRKVNEYAAEHGIDPSEYPQSLVDMLERNEETEDFVLSYPVEKDKKHRINMRDYRHCDSVPLFIQWDKRWGYKDYGGKVAGLTACGPLCMSMVSVYLLQDTKYSPDYMIDWALRNGYCQDGGGSLWTLISEGGEKLGLCVTELPLNEDSVVSNLRAGHPVICIMGPGDFTTKGHYIVMTDYSDGKIHINDPNSYANSQKEWRFDKISGQIRNLWAISKK